MKATIILMQYENVNFIAWHIYSYNNNFKCDFNEIYLSFWIFGIQMCENTKTIRTYVFQIVTSLQRETNYVRIICIYSEIYYTPIFVLLRDMVRPKMSITITIDMDILSLINLGSI